ncbi:MAG TPA: AAA family ATPase [Ktedonobacterales bacterium]
MAESNFDELKEYLIDFETLEADIAREATSQSIHHDEPASEGASTDNMSYFRRHGGASTGPSIESNSQHTREDRADPFRIYSLEDLKNWPAPTWLIEDRVPASGIAVMVGPPGTSKSFGAIGMGLSVAAGKPWLGQNVQQGQVIYVAAEGGSGISKRVRAWEKHHNVSAPIPFGVVTRPVQLLVKGEIDQFIARLKALPTPPRLIVFDTLARCMVGGDENSAKSMGQAIQSLDSIRRQFDECLILIIHHTAKAGGMRGSNALEGAVDTVIYVSKATGASTVTVSCARQKEAEAFTTRRVVLKPIHLGGDAQETSCVWDLAGGGADDRKSASNVDERELNLERALASLRSFGKAGTTRSTWQEAMNVSETTHKRWAEELKARGLAVTPAKKGRTYIWVAAVQVEEEAVAESNRSDNDEDRGPVDAGDDEWTPGPWEDAPELVSVRGGHPSPPPNGGEVDLIDADVVLTQADDEK